MVRKTKEEALETRALILDTAETVFTEKGVSRTTLNDIARAADLTRGAIYWHFKNKADLLDAMMQRVVLPLDEFTAASDSKAEFSPLEYVLQRSMHAVKTLAADARMQRVFDIVMHKAEMVDDLLPMRESHLNGQAQCIQKMTESFRCAIQKGELPSECDPQQAAVGLHALIDGLFSNWVLEPKRFALVSQAEFAIQCYLRGLQTLPVTGIPAP